MRRLQTLCLILMTALVQVHAVTEIELWHGFEGFIGEKFQEVIDDFNFQSGAYVIKPVYSGNLTETYLKGVEAAKNGKAPAILQVYEVATVTMMYQTELFRPVDDLMRSYYKKFDRDVYIDAVREFYSTPEGKMFSLPWNASTGILFYNKKAFAEAGLDPDHPPKTWVDVEKAGLKLANAGYKGFVTAWPAAYHLEHVCSWHNLPFASHSNGFDSLSPKLVFNGPTQIYHLSKLVDWQTRGIFAYKGRFTKEPEEFFAEGKCGILLQGANRIGILKRMTSEPIGVGFMPYWPHVTEKPFNLNIGGSSLWAMNGHSEEVYRGVAHFFNYLSQSEVQAYWHQATGYLPITEAAYYLTKKKGFYEKNPAAEIAVLEVMNQDQKPTPYTKGVRLGNYIYVREKIIDYLEKAFAGEMTPKEALDQAVKDGNQMLDMFYEEYKKERL